MGLDSNTLIKIIKKAAIDAVMARKPMAMCMGEVVSASPLKISIDQKMTLSATQLMLTSAVRDFEVETTADDSPDCNKISVHLGMNIGEKVILLRCDGGQKFIVLDRLEAPT